MTTSNPTFNVPPDGLSLTSDLDIEENIVPPIPPIATGTTGMSSMWGELIDPEVGNDWTRIEHPNISRPQTPVSEISGSMTSSALLDPTPSTSAGSEEFDEDPTSPLVDGFRRSETSSPAHGGIGKNPSSGTTATSWTWEDPDVSTAISSSTGTLHTPQRTHVGRMSTPAKNSPGVATLTSSQEHLIFPVLNASGLSSSDPSLDAVHEELTSTGSHRHDEDATSETPLLGTDESQLDAVVVGTTPLVNRQSFLANLANAARDRERVLSNGVESSLAGKHEVGSTIGEIKGRRRTVDKEWLEGVARSRFPLAGKDELLFESGMISLSDLGYAPLERQATSSDGAPDFGSPMWMDLLPGDWNAAKPGNGSVNATWIEVDAPVDGSAGRSRFEQAKRLAILALPLLAMTIWASFSPTNTLSLFENSEHINVKESLTTVLTSHASVESVLLKTPIASAAVATPPPCGTLTVHKESGAIEAITLDSNKSQTLREAKVKVKANPPVITQALAVMATGEQKPKVKSADHPLALIQKTLATATSGFHARGRQRAASTEQFTSSSNLGVRPHAADPVATSLLASPTAASWHAAYWHSGGFANASASLFPYATMPFAVLGRELQHLSSFVRCFLDGLLLKTRKFKEPMRQYFQYKDSPPKAQYEAIRAAKSRHPDAATKTAFGTSTKEAAEIVVERAWDELHQVFNALEIQLAGLRIRGDEAIAQAQQASRQTIKQARKGLDNVLRETADILERHTGVEMPLPASVERKKPRGPPPSSFSEKVQQLFHHAAVVLV